MRNRTLFILLLLLLVGAPLSAQDGEGAPPIDARWQRFVEGVGAPEYPTDIAPPDTFPAQVVSAIPQTIQEGLRRGGVNLQFGWYNVDQYRPNEFDAELPLIAAAGMGHVRLPMSMDTIEDGTSGRVRADRYQLLLGFLNLARTNGLVTIVDVHNTGMRECAGCGWSEHYMGGLSDPGKRARHLALLTDLAGRLGRDADTDWFVLQPANEPIEEQPWHGYQPTLFAAMRAACAECVLFVMAHDWQGVEATIYSLNTSFIDGRTIVDVHFYEPLGLTHCEYPGQTNRCPGLTYPGTYTTWRGTHLWDRKRLADMLAPLRTWQESRAVPFIHFSEVGTTAALAEPVRAAYLRDLTELFRGHGWGYTLYEWFKNFGVKQHPAVIAAAFNPGGIVPTPVPPVATAVATPGVLTPTPTLATTGGFPRDIVTTDARITVREQIAPVGDQRTFTVETSITPIRRIMVYVNGRWRADDSEPPYMFTVPVPAGATVSVLVVYNSNDNFYQGDLVFLPVAQPTVAPTLEPTVETTLEPTVETTLEPTVETTPEPTIVLTLTPAPTPVIPDGADFAEVARILREIQLLYGELADYLAPQGGQ